MQTAVLGRRPRAGGVRRLGSRGCFPSPRAHSEAGVVRPARQRGFGFYHFVLITKAIRCACRTSKSPKPSPEVTSLLTCIVNPSSLFASAHGRHFLFLQKEDVLHRFFFIQHSTAQHPPVLLPGDLMLLLSLGGYVHSAGLEVRILAPWLCHIGQLASTL